MQKTASLVHIYLTVKILSCSLVGNKNSTLNLLPRHLFILQEYLHRRKQMTDLLISKPSTKKNRIVKTLLLIAGTISLIFGTIGIFLPVLPTTPFLLLSAACYVRSSDRMYNWLLGNRWFGKYIKNYREGKGVPITTKIFAIAILWIGILYSAIFVIDEIFIGQLILLLIAFGVSIHLIRLPNFKNSCQ